MAGVDILASAFSGANAAFLGEQYARWAVNPASVDPTFAELFSALNDDARAVLEDATGASWAPRRPDLEGDEATRPAATPAAPPIATNLTRPTETTFLRPTGTTTATATRLQSDEQIRAATIASLRA